MSVPLAMNVQTEIPLRTGRRMPIVGLGTWQLTDDTAGTVTKALELGYRMIDTSGDYGTQPGVGEAVRRSGIDRSELFIVTKIEETDDLSEATVNNLRELQMEYVDLMLIHRPPQSGAGKDLWDGLMRARDGGLCRDIGVSNYSRDLIDQLRSASGEAPVVNQIEWSPFGHSTDMLDYARKNAIVIQAYSPLTRTNRLDDPRVVEIASKYDKSPAQLLIRWNMQLGTVPLPKANKCEHLEENTDVSDFRIHNDDMATLNALNEHYSALGTLPYS